MGISVEVEVKLATLHLIGTGLLVGKQLVFGNDGGKLTLGRQSKAAVDLVFALKIGALPACAGNVFLGQLAVLDLRDARSPAGVGCGICVGLPPLSAAPPQAHKPRKRLKTKITLNKDTIYFVARSPLNL